ncbi:MAG: hypothetical protein OEQ53_14695, partial [Saprospiraceae bacterium]|nr:hypothetical protein [Saprospiraceae bacterium]
FLCRQLIDNEKPDKKNKKKSHVHPMNLVNYQRPYTNFMGAPAGHVTTLSIVAALFFSHI